MAKKEAKSLTDLFQQFSAEKDDELIPTGLLQFDKMLGGGINPGSIYSMWGPAGSGKSSIAAQVVKSFCKLGYKCVWVDVEKALNQKQQEAFGLRQYVSDGSLVHLYANTYEDADKITSAIASDNSLNIKLVVIDSETMLMPKIGDDQSVNDNQPGQKARQASVWLTKMKNSFFEAGITGIVLSHARANISMTANPYAPKEKQAGGYGLQHVPDCIVKIIPGQKFGDKTSPVGQVIHVSLDKSKFSQPFVNYDMKLFFGYGIKKKVEIIDLAIEQHLIEQNGSFFKLPNGETVRGTEALYNLDSTQLKELQSRLDSTL